MKNLLSILLAVLLFNLANAKAPDSVFVQQSAPNLSQPDLVSAWCNTFHLQVTIGGFGLTTSISTSFDLCCVAMIWQTCFNPRPDVPENYGYNLYLEQWDSSISQTAESKKAREIIVEKSSTIEIEKSLYSIQTGKYEILKDKKGKYIEVILKKN